MTSLLLASTDPAGGAALDQVALATGGAMLATAIVAWVVHGHVTGRNRLLGRLGGFAERVGGGLPGWAALPTAVAGGSLIIALLGMYWDIALHIGQGRDEGPLANPAHYLILIGLYGSFTAGVLSVALSHGRDPGPSGVRLQDGWRAPVGGLLMIAAAGFALLGFPLDDVWHRLFGQDVTLWGPTHLMLIGGAGLTLIGQATLVIEGTRARERALAAGDLETQASATRIGQVLLRIRGVALMGGLLIGLSTFQAEFDFGVPQFQLVFQPVLVAVAAGVALVAARLWLGRGGALGAAVVFLVIRGLTSGFVALTGETVPVLPLYLGAALCVEVAAVWLARRPLALGAVAGALIGTAGLATEWAWSHAVMPLPWTEALLPEALIAGLAAGLAGGVVGGLLGAALRGDLPRPAVARPALVGALVVVGALVANGLVTTTPAGPRVAVSLQEVSGAPQREALATVRVLPPAAAEDARWLTVTAWQGGGLVVDRLERVGRGVYRSTQPVPLHGDWKALVRLHTGRQLVAAPIYLPEDEAIPAPEVPAPAGFTRPLVDETPLLQRELKDDVPGWLWTAASVTVLLIALAFIATLSWGLGRVARRWSAQAGAPRGTGTPPSARPSRPTPAARTSTAGHAPMTSASACEPAKAAR